MVNMSYEIEKRAILDAYSGVVLRCVKATVFRVGMDKAMSAMKIAMVDGELVPDIFICNLGDSKLLEQYMFAKDWVEKKLTELDYKYAAKALLNYLYGRG